MAGFEGNMLEVNLSSGDTKKTVIDKGVLRKFIGGSGLAARLMFDRVDPKIDALSPQNELFIVCGPTSGTALPGGARFSVCAKSPLTNMFAESSCGGDFASKLRSATGCFNFRSSSSITRKLLTFGHTHTAILLFSPVEGLFADSHPPI